MSKDKNTYDILIVGAGLAGLHCALRISKIYPKLHIAIAEAYGYVGGRVVTYTPPGQGAKSNSIHWENGAGRIHGSHKFIKNYINHYGLHLVPISSKEDWRKSVRNLEESNVWPELCEILVNFLSPLHPRILATHTIKQILVKTHGTKKSEEILARFPYRSEAYTLRADLALKSFTNEMQSSENFFTVQEGLSTLVLAMHKDLESRGVKFLMNHRLLCLNKNPLEQIVSTFGSGSITSNKVILALHSEALKKIPLFTNMPMLKHLAMKPLLRTYGIFPTPAWFSNLHATVTDSPLRHIIPINPNQGTIMTSYTDAQDADYWLDKEDIEKETMNELRSLFPNIKIPDPLFFKTHPWSEGCTYWLPGPGLYNPEEISKKIMKPFPNTFNNVYVCGESYSMRQAWMEGALEHADSMVNKYFL